MITQTEKEKCGEFTILDFCGNLLMMKREIKIILVVLVLVLIVFVYFLKNPFWEKTETPQDMIPLEYTAWDDGFLSLDLPLLLDFGSEQCPPCNAMKPDLEVFWKESYGKVRVLYADIWANPALTGGLPASVVPTQFFFEKGGKPYEPSEDVSSQIRFLQYAYKDSGELALTCHQGILSKEEMYMIFSDMGVEL